MITRETLPQTSHLAITFTFVLNDCAHKERRYRNRHGFWEGEAPAEPDKWDKGQGARDTEKDWAHREVRPPIIQMEKGGAIEQT